MYIETRKGSHYHKGFVDSETKDFVCICGAVQDPRTKKWSHGEGMETRKYHNKPCEYDGVIYDSTLEARQAADLDWRVRAGELIHWVRQVPIDFYVCLGCARLSRGQCPDHPHEKPVHLARYICDFRAHRKDGTVEYIETKGVATDVFRLKWKLMEAVFGRDEDVEMILVKEPRRRFYPKNQNK